MVCHNTCMNRGGIMRFKKESEISVQALLDHINLYGNESSCYLFIDKKNKTYSHYEFDLFHFNEEKYTYLHCSLEETLKLVLSQIFQKRNNFFSIELITARLLLKFTQKEVAEKIGVHQNLYQKWELGLNFPSTKNYWKLQKVLKL